MPEWFEKFDKNKIPDWESDKFQNIEVLTDKLLEGYTLKGLYNLSDYSTLE